MDIFKNNFRCLQQFYFVFNYICLTFLRRISCYIYRKKLQCKIMYSSMLIYPIIYEWLSFLRSIRLKLLGKPVQHSTVHDVHFNEVRYLAYQ